MTADEKYLLLIRNIRRRINDSVTASPAPGEQVVFSNDDLKDEIDLAVKFLGIEDVLVLPNTHYELIILRVWFMVAKMLAFDSCKFFTITQTNQTFNKGERTQHYLSVAQNLESLFDKALDQIDGGIVVGDVHVLDRNTLQEDTAVSDSPPPTVFLRAFEKLPVDAEKGYIDGDYMLSWGRSNEWDFNQYKFYIGDTPTVNRHTGRALLSVSQNSVTSCKINFSGYTGTKYIVVYVLDNREQYSEPSEALTVTFETGSV